jgi:hypothetical protein
VLENLVLKKGRMRVRKEMAEARGTMVRNVKESLGIITEEKAQKLLSA